MKQLSKPPRAEWLLDPSRVDSLYLVVHARGVTVRGPALMLVAASFGLGGAGGPPALAHDAPVLASGTAAVATVSGSPAGDARSRRRRAGCGRFCRQAGPAAGDGAAECTPAPCMVQLTRRTALRRDGTVLLSLRCRLTRPCVGAIVLYSNSDLKPSGRRGGGDFVVPARRSGVVAIHLLQTARALLRRDHHADLGTYCYVRGPRIVFGGQLSVSG